jgi:hypothetical protein
MPRYRLLTWTAAVGRGRSGVEWTDAAVAVIWANGLVVSVNARRRADAVQEAMISLPALR